MALTYPDIVSAEICVMVLAGWFVTWLLANDVAYPDGPIFPLCALYLAAVAASWVARLKVFNAPVPNLLGMIIAGAVLRNVGAVNGLESAWSGAIRKLALAVILIRGGLFLDAKAIVRLGRPTMLLATLPCLVEAAVVACTARLLFTEPRFPWPWCAMLGFIVAAVSPAVIVPSLTELSKKGYGVKQGIPSMVLAAAGIDDVVAVTGFGVAFGISFSSNLALSIAQGPIDLAIGLAAPVLIGYPLTKVVLDDRFNLGISIAFKAGCLLFVGVALIVGLGKLGHTGGGALATMLLGVAIQRFSADAASVIVPADVHIAAVWDRLAKPFLFVLIGAAIDVGTLSGSVVGYGLAIIAVGLVFRLPAVLACVQGTPLTRKERLFVTLAWLPKATVQAALGSLALDKVEEADVVDEDEKGWAEKILAISVLAILCTAPLGAVLIEVRNAFDSLFPSLFPPPLPLPLHQRIKKKKERYTRTRTRVPPPLQAPNQQRQQHNRFSVNPGSRATTTPTTTSRKAKTAQTSVATTARRMPPTNPRPTPTEQTAKAVKPHDDGALTRTADGGCAAIEKNA